MSAQTETPPAVGEIAALGRRIYHARLKVELERDHFHEFAVINVDTGEYEVAPDDVEAVDRALARWPEGRFYHVLVGEDTMGLIGDVAGKA